MFYHLRNDLMQLEVTKIGLHASSSKLIWLLVARLMTSRRHSNFKGTRPNPLLLYIIKILLVLTVCWLCFINNVILFLQGVIVEGDQQITSASVSQNVQDTHTDITSRGGIRPLAAAYRAMSSQQDVSFLHVDFNGCY